MWFLRQILGELSFLLSLYKSSMNSMTLAAHQQESHREHWWWKRDVLHYAVKSVTEKNLHEMICIDPEHSWFNTVYVAKISWGNIFWIKMSHSEGNSSCSVKINGMFPFWLWLVHVYMIALMIFHFAHLASRIDRFLKFFDLLLFTAVLLKIKNDCTVRCKKSPHSLQKGVCTNTFLFSDSFEMLHVTLESMASL